MDKEAMLYDLELLRHSMDIRQIMTLRKLKGSCQVSEIEILWNELLSKPKLPGRRMMAVTPQEAHYILMNDYLVKIFDIKRIHDKYSIETPGYADEMRAGKWRIRDKENYIPVTGLSCERLSNRRLWMLLQSGKTAILPMWVKYVNFEEVYKQNLKELPGFLNDFFKINLINLNNL